MINNNIAEKRQQVEYSCDADRRLDNMKEASDISLPYLQTFCNEHNIKLEITEKTELDWKGVDYIITIPGHEPLNCSFRLIKGLSKKFHLRWSGGEGGVSEARKILSGETQSVIYITLELQTNTLRFYKISDIKKWLESSNRFLNTGKDGSRYYSIPFSDLRPIKEAVVFPL